MSQYYKCQPAMPLTETGVVEFVADSPKARSLLSEAVGIQSPDNEDIFELHYENHTQLLQLISCLESQLEPEDIPNIKCRIAYDIREEDAPADAEKIDKEQAWIPLSELIGEKVSGRPVSDYILHRLFTTYLQPIVQPSGKIIGYEFLMRPLPELAPFRPAELFRSARHIGQHSFLDRAARQSAIRLSASHLGEGIKRFINFLPSSLHCPNACLEETFELMRETETNPEDYVFEVMETERLDEPELKKVFNVYREKGVLLALDDVGSGYATLNAVDQLQPDYVKMDRKWVSGCDSDDTKKRYIDELLDRVSNFHGVVLAEGVERKEEWDYLRKAGIPLFQGYLFGEATPVPYSAPATNSFAALV